MAKAYIVDPLALAGVRLGYTRPLDGSELADARKHVTGLDLPAFPGELRPRFANVTALTGSTGAAVDSFSFGSEQKHPLGTMAVTRDGRIFRYAQAGATLLVVGNVEQGAAPIAAHLANTPPAVAIGAKSFTYTPGATAGAANLYAEGFLSVDTTPGNGYTYQVSGHGAITASTAFTLYLEDPIQVALTTASRVGLHHNNWKNVIQAPTTVTANVAGIAVSAIPAGEYGWVQTRGPAAVLINGTPGVGTGVVVSVTTAGAVDVSAAIAAEVNFRQIGRMMQVGVSTKNNLVYVTLD